MTKTSRRIDALRFLICALLAPGTSVIICGLLAHMLPQDAKGLRALEPALLLNPFAFLLVSVLGAPSSVIFGLAGCLLAERRLQGRPLWLWGGAGLAAAGVYAALGTLLHRIPAFDILAPWAGMLREPEPWSVDACIIASILASGLIAGTAYRLASREV
nr:hypothetical protein [uncultured Brevundimonas sp.]